MANEEHLAILRQGVEVWNKWREKNPGIKPDLRRADLGGADLRGANLFDADLMGVDFLQGPQLQFSSSRINLNTH